MRGRSLHYSLAVLIAAMVVALSGAFAGCSASSSTRQSSSHSPLRIGAILSLSGTYASMGAVEKQSLELETKKINAAGGVNGHPIELIIENDNTDESKAVSAAEKLINKDKVIAILGATGTGPTMAIRSSVEKANIPQISMAGGNVITGQLSSHVFQTPWTNELLLDNLFKTLKGRGVKRIALVTDSGGYGKDGRAIALEKAQKYALELAVDTTFKPGDTDMAAQVASVKKSNAQAIVLWNAGKEAPLFVKQYKLSGSSLPIYGGSGQARAEFIEGAGKYAEGVTIITGKSFVPASWKDNTNERNAIETFFKRFNDSYGSDPDIFAGHAYDALHLVANAAGAMSDAELNALAKEDNAAQKSFLKNLESTNNFYGFGGTFAYSSKDHNGLTSEDTAYFYVKDGKWVQGAAQGLTGQSQTQSSLAQLADLIINTLKNASLYALIALGFIVVYLTTGSLNFAQGEFVALAGLTAALLTRIGLPLSAAIVVTLILSLCLGWLFNAALIAPLMKRNNKHLVVQIVIITIGASVLLRQIALHIFGPDELALPSLFKTDTLKLGTLSIETQTLALICFALIAFIVFAFLYKYARFGKAMRAYEQSPEGAQLVGVSAKSIVRSSFMLSSFVGALAGILITPLTQMSFDSGVNLGIKGFAVALIGGLTNPLYALLSAVLLAGLETLSGVFIDPIYKDVIAYVLIILVLVLRPQGLFARARKEKL